jgi:hypothetical protein
LYKLKGFKADLQLIGALVNLAVALKRSATIHNVESRDLINYADEFQLMIQECMNSPSMDYPENVTKVIL